MHWPLCIRVLRARFWGGNRQPSCRSEARRAPARARSDRGGVAAGTWRGARRCDAVARMFRATLRTFKVQAQTEAPLNTGTGQKSATTWSHGAEAPKSAVVRALSPLMTRSFGATPRGACIAIPFLGRFFRPVRVLSGAFIRTFTLIS